MNYLLILDDTRSVEDVKNISPEPFKLYPELPIVVALDFKNAQQIMLKSEGLCEHVCFDHNLYGSKNHMDLTGADFANWLDHHDHNRKQMTAIGCTYSVHTTDEKGAAEIRDAMDLYKEIK